VINIKSDWRRSRCQPSLHGKSSDQTRSPYPAGHLDELVLRPLAQSVGLRSVNAHPIRAAHQQDGLGDLVLHPPLAGKGVAYSTLASPSSPWAGSVG
jgi:hypothetical protein